MKRTTLLLSSALSLLPFAPAFAQDGKDVTIVLAEDIDLMEPCMATRSNIGRIIMENINETLTQYDVKDGKGVLPRLADSWKDQGNGTWRFNLHQGVTFSDGSTFDANDVKASFERAMSDKLTCETPRYFGDTKLTFNVVDDNTIDITADPAQPILPLLVSLVTMVPSETPLEFVREPIGTGPYKLASWTPGQSVSSSAATTTGAPSPPSKRPPTSSAPTRRSPRRWSRRVRPTLRRRSRRSTPPIPRPTSPTSTPRRPTCASTALSRRSTTSAFARR